MGRRARSARLSACLGASALLASSCGPTASTEDAGPVDAISTGVDAFTERPRHERYIRGDLDTRLVIELDVVTGAEPRAGVANDLVARLNDLLDKPAGIEVVMGSITSRGADHAWTEADLFALGDETFANDAPAGTIVMHVMWLDGHHALDTASGAILAVAWAHTHIAVFENTIEANCGGQPLLGDRLCTEAQYGVWLHEVGHVLGLVDNGTPMVTPHIDSAHGRHDSNDGCLMYWAYESSAGLDALSSTLLGGGDAPDFDAECLADIAAVRNR